MVNCYWKLEHRKLKGTGLTVEVTESRIARSRRQSLTDIHNNGQDREGTGLNKGTKNFTFIITGDGGAKWDKLDEILATLENDDVWTLEAPDRHGLTVYKKFIRAAFSTSSYTEDDEKALGKISISVDAIVDGVWIADGGDYCETLTGSYEKTATGWIDDKGKTYTGDPTIELPEQVLDYPQAKSATTFLFESLSRESLRAETSEDGDTIVYETYDLTGYLHPVPTAVGDVGTYEICHSITRAFMSGGTDSASQFGVTEYAVSEGAVSE